MPDQKTFRVVVATGEGESLVFQISADEFNIPDAFSYVFTTAGATVASFPKNSVLAVIEETAFIKVD